MLVPGDVLQYTWSGGGGFGDPRRRDPAAVARDVDEGVVSPARAEGVYGSVVREGAVDVEATTAARPRRAPGGPRLEGGRLLLACGCPRPATVARDLERPGLRLHASLRLVEYACASCGARLSVELEETAA